MVDPELDEVRTNKLLLMTEIGWYRSARSAIKSAKHYAKCNLNFYRRDHTVVNIAVRKQNPQ